MRALPTLLLAAPLIAACGSRHSPPPAPAPVGQVIDERAGLVLPDEGFGDGATKLVYLDQGWGPAETLWFYYADQGSVLLPRRVLVNLEQPDASAKFLDPAHLTRLRLLPQRVTPNNPDGLPVGFARHGDQVGLTCAACHTSQLEYGDTAMRIDGGQGLLHVDGMLEAMERAMAATLADEAKLGRYLAAIPAAEREAATAELRGTLEWFVDYNKANHADVTDGFGRIDAVGRILNQVVRLTSGSENSVPPDAPTSFPVLWDAPRHDYVQWAAFGPNAGLGSLGRNVGEVTGVFGRIDVVPYTDARDAQKGYTSTVNGHNLVQMEALLWSLQSPAWPEDILPPIDRAKADRGAAVYQQGCASCHAVLDRDDPDRRVRAQVYGLDEVGTDPATARNLVKAVAPTGKLNGSVDAMGNPLGAETPTVNLLGTLVTRAIAGMPAAALEGTAYAKTHGLEDQEKQGTYASDSETAPRASWLAYKARPLNGIWASAPYLHNGSVPTLYDLLLPVDQRPTTFSVGRRELDPVKVGPVQDGEAPFRFDTRAAGSSNVGHTYGTELPDEDRWALVEYLKTL